MLHLKRPSTFFILSPKNIHTLIYRYGILLLNDFMLFLKFIASGVKSNRISL
jgi:hypothetical protein